MKESGDLYKEKAYIHTAGGGRFYMATPTWEIRPMAHALSQLARYNGHCKEQYSVAEHSVLVSLLMEHVTGGDPFEGLLHDGTESVMSDVPAPWKQFLPDWGKIDHELETDMRKTFGLPPVKTVECKSADWLALFIEAAQLVEGEGEDFEDPGTFRPRAIALRKQGWYVHAYRWEQAKELFLYRYTQLQSMRAYREREAAKV